MQARIETFMEAFGMSEYPVLFRYADDLPKGTLFPPEGARTCLFALLAKTRTEGMPVALSPSHHGCPGGGYYLGFLDTPREGIEYFLSCGIPGKMEGERYLKTPELARARFAQVPVRPAPKRYGLFTRADMPHSADDPQVVVFFASPDLLAGLHFLASFDPSLRGEEPADPRRAVRAVHEDGGQHPGEFSHDKDVGDDPEADPGIGSPAGTVEGERRGKGL